MQVGNFINHGNNQRGNAIGFELSSLATLNDTKSFQQNNYTMMNYVAQWLCNKDNLYNTVM
jgi:hypothetical protein